MLFTEKLTVDQLEIGMYVVELDRPWLDTPFLFQGFYIRDEDEIVELAKHCAYVLVTRESLQSVARESRIGETPGVNGKATKSSVVKARTTKKFSLRGLFGLGDSSDAGDFEQTNVIYENTTGLREETRHATGVHSKAVAAVEGVMQNLQKSGSLEINQLESAVTPMVDSVLRNPAALACLVRMQKKDDYLYHHSLASSVWATILARQIGLARADLDVIALGAMLLDVGKTQVPEAILTKPSKLTDSEAKLMRMHVQFGLDILDKVGKVDSRVLDMVAHHHERYNGTGYPAGLQGHEIPVFGRIAGIVDAYDAMITQRPYADMLSSHDALRKLRNLSDVEFQAEMVDQFTKAIGAFPTGTLVELNTGEVAIVTKQNRIRRLRPEIMIIINTEKEMLDDFRVLDLNDEKVTADGSHSLWIERGLPPGAHGVDPSEFYLN